MELQDEVRKYEKLIEEKRGLGHQTWSFQILLNMPELKDFGYEPEVYSRKEIVRFQDRLKTAVYGLLRLTFSETELGLRVDPRIGEDHVATIYVRYVWL